MRLMRGLVILAVVIVASIMLVAGCWAQATSQRRDLASQIHDTGPLAVLVGVEEVTEPNFAAIPDLDTGAATVAADILAQSLAPFLIPKDSRNPLEDAYENIGNLSDQDITEIMNKFDANCQASTNPIARTIKIDKGQFKGILKGLADEKTRQEIIQKAALYIKSTMDKDAALKQLGQALLTAADTAITIEYNATISGAVAISAGVPQATGREYGENFVALGYKVMDDILQDQRFKNLDKKFVESLIDIAAQNNGIANGDLDAFRQGEDRAINSTRGGAAKTASIYSQPSAQPTTSQANWINIGKVLVVIVLALGILVALVVR